MGRLLLNYILPLVLPLAIYATYIWWRRRRAKRHDGDIPAIERNHVFVSMLLGFVLMIASLTFIAVVSGVAPGKGQYQSPRYDNGKIIPPSFN